MNLMLEQISTHGDRYATADLPWQLQICLYVFCMLTVGRGWHKNLQMHKSVQLCAELF
jgi:hypothetical protein